MIGEYKYKHRNEDENPSRFGISSIEGIVEKEKDLISSVELIKIPNSNIILLENPVTKSRYWGPGINYFKEIFKEVSREFENQKGFFENSIGLMEGESPRDKDWAKIYRAYHWKHFSREYPYWLAKGMNFKDTNQIEQAKRIIKEIFKIKYSN